MQRPQVEKYRAVQQRLRIAAINPVRESCLPLFVTQAPLRVAGHHIAFAQRKATACKGLIDALGERQQARAKGVRLGSSDKNDAVVLIRAEGLLETAFAAECDPAHMHVLKPGTGQLEVYDALGQQVVERGDEVRKLPR